MSKLEERESRRRESIVGNMIEKPTEKTPGSRGRGRPKEEGRELKKRIGLSVLPSLYEDSVCLSCFIICGVFHLLFSISPLCCVRST